MKNNLIYFLFFLSTVSLAQELTIENGYSSFEILPSGIKTNTNTDLNTSNTLIGKKILNNWTPNAINNVGFGEFNLNDNQTGSDNVAIGYSSLYSNTIGNQNVALGKSALESNTIGTGNIAFGFNAIQKTIAGVYNIGIGENALQNASNSTYNIAVGRNTMQANSILGIDNIAFGSQALQANSGGDGNIAFGSGVLGNNISGKNNIGFGSTALLSYNSSGNANIAFGIYSQLSTTTGSYNISFGTNSLSTNTYNSYSIAIGENTLEKANVSNALAFGYNSLSKLVNGQGNIGIGRYTLRELTTGNHNLAMGFYSSENNVIGSKNVSIGRYALEANIANENIGFGDQAGRFHLSGDGNIFLGANSDDSSPSKNISNSAAIGYLAGVSSNNTYVMGIPTTSSIGGYANWSNYSDRRLKTKIKYDNSLGLSFIKELKTAKYVYREDKNNRVLDGLIAQDVQETLRALDLDWSGLVELDDQDKTLTIAYNQLTIPLVNATQQLKEKLDRIKIRMAELAFENAQLEELNNNYNDFISSSPKAIVTE